ncbi:MAG: ribosome-associated translation inhibitor RaiA [Victivallales bacterium]|nr:ribosome-associated translation inhibitor RaiA [Victivallales bacterium]
MQVIISGRHVTVTEEMKQHIEAKTLDIMSRKSLKITSIRAILSLESQNRYKAELIVNMKNHTFEADAETYDVYESIDAAVDKVSSQIKKLVDKVQDHRKTPLSEVAPVEDLDEEAELEYELD